MSSSVVDALWLADCEISAMEEDGEGTAEDSNSNEGASGHVPSQSAAQARQASAKAKAPRLARLVMELVRCSAIDKNACLRRLSPALLAGSGLVGDAQTISKMLLRANTRKLYVQQKYNLLHEDAEGYSKLFTELSAAAALVCPSYPPSTSYSAPASMSEASAKALSSRVTSLIGHFHLDPNRVEDMIIEALELNVLRYAAYLPLIRMFRKDRLCHILGRKFHVHQISNVEGDIDDNADVDRTTTIGTTSIFLTNMLGSERRVASEN